MWGVFLTSWGTGSFWRRARTPNVLVGFYGFPQDSRQKLSPIKATQASLYLLFNTSLNHINCEILPLSWKNKNITVNRDAHHIMAQGMVWSCHLFPSLYNETNSEKEFCCSRSWSLPINMVIIIYRHPEKKTFYIKLCTYKYGPFVRSYILVKSSSIKWIFKDDNWLREIDDNHFKKIKSTPFCVAVRWKINIIHNIICCNICPVRFQIIFKSGAQVLYL